MNRHCVTTETTNPKQPIKRLGIVYFVSRHVSYYAPFHQFVSTDVVVKQDFLVQHAPWILMNAAVAHVMVAMLYSAWIRSTASAVSAKQVGSKVQSHQ
jgi:hypothetical protein